LTKIKERKNIQTDLLINNNEIKKDSTIAIIINENKVFANYFLNDSILIEIPVNYSLGALWQIYDTPSSIYLNKKSESQKVEDGKLQSYQQFYFIALERDTIQLNFKLIKPYDSNFKGIESKTFHLIIN
jgi:hypothetical protein